MNIYVVKTRPQQEKSISHNEFYSIVKTEAHRYLVVMYLFLLRYYINKLQRIWCDQVTYIDSMYIRCITLKNIKKNGLC